MKILLDRIQWWLDPTKEKVGAIIMKTMQTNA